MLERRGVGGSVDSRGKNGVTQFKYANFRARVDKEKYSTMSSGYCMRVSATKKCAPEEGATSKIEFRPRKKISYLALKN